RIPDGTYRASSTAYAGQLHVAVTVQSGRIESVKITKHKERQFYSAFTDTPNQIVARQSVKGVDAVTGATMTSEAIINAAAKALASAMR
ncbi:MAG: FMN-binding protein, partial [Planctomycetota bacterium]